MTDERDTPIYGTLGMLCATMANVLRDNADDVLDYATSVVLLVGGIFWLWRSWRAGRG